MTEPVLIATYVAAVIIVLTIFSVVPRLARRGNRTQLFLPRAAGIAITVPGILLVMGCALAGTWLAAEGLATWIAWAATVWLPLGAIAARIATRRRGDS